MGQTLAVSLQIADGYAKADASQSCIQVNVDKPSLIWLRSFVYLVSFVVPTTSFAIVIQPRNTRTTRTTRKRPTAPTPPIGSFRVFSVFGGSGAKPFRLQLHNEISDRGEQP